MKMMSIKSCLIPLLAPLAFVWLAVPSIHAQGSIFGLVTNSDNSTPANGEISFIGFLNDSDEEIRVESSDGAGYDEGNWYDDFQNYLSESPGNPYDYYFFNLVNSEGFHLSGSIPNNSFQQENVSLAQVTWPFSPSSFSGHALSPTVVKLIWTSAPDVTCHVYRRPSLSNGAFFRVDDITGSLSNPGVAGEQYYDSTVDGSGSYDYLLVAESASGDLSPHSEIISVNSAAWTVPVIEPVDDQFGRVGLQLTFEVLAFDPEGDFVSLSAENLPNGASFIQQGWDESLERYRGTFTWLPLAFQDGVYTNIRFIASDGGLTSQTFVHIEIDPFICGDVDNDGDGPDIVDLSILIDYLFRQGPVPIIIEAADVNGSGDLLDINDILYIASYLFLGGPAPACRQS